MNFCASTTKLFRNDAKFRQKFRSLKTACHAGLSAKNRVNSGKNSGIAYFYRSNPPNSGIFAGIPPQKRPLSLMPRGFAPPEFLPEFVASTTIRTPFPPTEPGNPVPSPPFPRRPGNGRGLTKSRRSVPCGITAPSRLNRAGTN